MSISVTIRSLISLLSTKDRKILTNKDYLQFRFLLFEGTKSSSPKPPAEGSASKLVTAEEVTDFVEQVGQNTDYVIHPEEILADNFALLVIGQQNVSSGNSAQDEGDSHSKVSRLRAAAGRSRRADP